MIDEWLCSVWGLRDGRPDMLSLGTSTPPSLPSATLTTTTTTTTPLKLIYCLFVPKDAEEEAEGGGGREHREGDGAEERGNEWGERREWGWC